MRFRVRCSSSISLRHHAISRRHDKATCRQFHGFDAIASNATSARAALPLPAMARSHIRCVGHRAKPCYKASGVAHAATAGINDIDIFARYCHDATYRIKAGRQSCECSGRSSRSRQRAANQVSDIDEMINMNAVDAMAITKMISRLHFLFHPSSRMTGVYRKMILIVKVEAYRLPRPRGLRAGDYNFRPLSRPGGQRE